MIYFVNNQQNRKSRCYKQWQPDYRFQIESVERDPFI